MWNTLDASIVGGNHKGRCGDTGSTQQPMVRGRNQEADDQDTREEDEVDSERHQFGCVCERESGAFGFASDDSDENLVAYSPDSEKCAFSETLRLVSKYSG